MLPAAVRTVLTRLQGRLGRLHTSRDALRLACVLFRESSPTPKKPLVAPGDTSERPKVRPAREVVACDVRLAVAVGLGSVVVARLIEYETSNEPIYAFLVAAVAISVWYGGAGSGLVTLAICWSLAPLILYPGQSFSVSDRGDLDRWGLTLVAALIVVWVSIVMRRGQQRAARAADLAERSSEQMEVLQKLAVGLSNAVSSAEVAHVITDQAMVMLGAQGSALGLVEGEDLVIVDPVGLAARAHVPGGRLALTSPTLVTQSARRVSWCGSTTGRPWRGRSRTARSCFQRRSKRPSPSLCARWARWWASWHSSTSGGARWTTRRWRPRRPSPALPSRLSSARACTSASGSRAGHWIGSLRVAPGFHAETVEEVTGVICREARATFGADFGVLWQLRDSQLVLLNSDPVHEEMPQGLQVPLDDLSGLAEAVANHGVSFSRDVLLGARGGWLERVRRMGVRSSLRSPIVIGARAELVLAVSWQMVISEPEPLHGHPDAPLRGSGRPRSRAARAAPSRGRGRSSGGGHGTSAGGDGGSLAGCDAQRGRRYLPRACALAGGGGGVRGLPGSHREAFDFVSSQGFGDDELEAWRAFGPDADVPFTRALASGQAVWALTPEDMGAFTEAGALRDAGWAAIPLKRGANVQGALHLTFRRPRPLSEAERSWLETVASQCALALERSRLLEEEKLRRVRSERLQNMTAALSNALTQKDVAEVVVEVLCEELEPDAASVSSVVEDRATLRALAWRGYPDELADDEISLETDTPETGAVRGEGWQLHTSEDVDPNLESKGDVSYAVAPLVAGRKRIGVVAMSWDTPFALSGEDRAFIESTAGQAALALDRARIFESERATAETLQRSVLPASLPRVDGVQLAARYLPGSQGVAVGGDWFDALELHDGRLGLIVGDVMGKGVQAAASMGQLRNALRAFSVERLKPSSALARLDRLGDETREAALQLSSTPSSILETVSFAFSSAGHPPPVVAYPDGRVELLEDGRGLPLGTGMRPQYRQAVAELPAEASSSSTRTA